jgi:hypothetical protein
MRMAKRIPILRAGRTTVLEILTRALHLVAKSLRLKLLKSARG